MKRIFLIGLISLSVSGIRAQVLKPFTFGPFISYNNSSLKANPDFNSVTPETGYGFGAFCRLKILMLYAELEAGYSLHNTSTSTQVNGTNYVSTFALGGLDASVIVGWRVFGIGRLGNFRLFTGYNYSNFSKTEVETNGSILSASGILSDNNGIILGTGIDVWKFVLNAKYVFGLNDIASSPSQKIETRTMNVGLGFKF